MMSETSHPAMLDKSTLLKAFNKHFFEFLDEFIRIFPENTDIKVSRNTFDTFRKANPTAIVKAWHLFVHIPYSDVIAKGDIAFFFDKDYSDDLTNVQNQNYIMEMIEKLRGPIKEMSPENIAHSTKYMQNLGKLSALYAKSTGI
jgi:hypothetical protein